MKRLDLIRAIQELGCEFVRHGAKHDWYRNPVTGVTQPVPRHREIKERLGKTGIPARLAGGLMYAPIFGGSFGQHAWVEVHLGPAGWVTLDPTTGEYEKVGATHIKLFGGMGGVVPKSIKVVAFQPPNQFVHATPPRKALPLPWKFDRKYTFTFTQAGKELGSEVVTITKVKHAGKDAYRMKSDLNLVVLKNGKGRRGHT